MFLSNTLMIATPVLLSILFSIGMSAVLAQVFDDWNGDTNEAAFVAANMPQIAVAGIVMVVVMVAVIIITNRILTSRMVKSIVTPLDTLSYGVEQLKDGNLNFRLDYLGNDEFAPVCAAFNEMVKRLQYLENTRRRDEESRRELIAGISHDLKTPLTAIKAYVEGLENGVAETPEQKQKYFDIIGSKTEDLEHIIEQLFLFSKLDTDEFPLKLTRTNIGQEIRGAIQEFAEEYQDRGLSLHVKQPIPDSDTWVDTMLLRRVMLNVFENSLKYKANENGKVFVSVQHKNENVLIRITDDGPGVPEENLSKLFDVFYRVDASRGTKGSGLGLAISAKIMKRMGGGISAEIPSGGGLAIVLNLPLANEVTV
jgi:signal transduction histidine kinase